MNPGTKRALFLALDLAVVPIALLGTALFQQTQAPTSVTFTAYLNILPFLLVVSALCLLALGLPSVRLRAYDLNAILRTALFAMATSCAFWTLASLAGTPMPAGRVELFFMTLFLLSAGARMVLLHIVTRIYARSSARTNVVIYGAGITGIQLAAALKNHRSINVVAFVDDSRALQGLSVCGLPVHDPSKIDMLQKTRGVCRALLAMQSLDQSRQIQIAEALEKKGIEVHILPSFAPFTGRSSLLEKLRPFSEGKYIGREVICGARQQFCRSYRGKSVLITGAGGSIGSELCRQILACNPAKLILLELSEAALYQIHKDLRRLNLSAGVDIIPVLGTVTDARQMRHLLKRYDVQVVLHAAAYKHVPLVEANPLPGLANNVLGTQTLAKLSRELGVERFILLSSDKAVRPAGMMGASKRLAEMVVRDLAQRSPRTVFAIVRFGNVMGSSGSVIPLFTEQILRGGPVTVTDPDVSRYFMTVQEAVDLVLHTGSFAKGGEAFVLDMGKPMKIGDLARRMIEAAGRTVRDEAHPNGDIEIIFNGLRPGEKLHEDLYLSPDLKATDHPKVFADPHDMPSEIEIASALRGLRQAIANHDEDSLRAVIAKWVDGDIAPQRAEMI